MDAVVILDKPAGITSHDAVVAVKRALGVKKAGHAGTLDPLATGVLLVCVGEGTKVTGYLGGLQKEYIATMKLGERTDTLDAEGAVIERAEGAADVNEPEVLGALERFRGAILQTPPMYSAIKVGGKPLYKLARQGLEVERKEREVLISHLSLEGFAPPFISIRVICSKGTYIRSLCDDIGQALGLGAHMTALRRTRIGRFRVEDAARPDELPIKKAAIISLDSALDYLPSVVLDAEDFRRASNGGALSAGKYDALMEGGAIRLKRPDGGLFALGEYSGGRLRVIRILHI